MKHNCNNYVIFPSFFILLIIISGCIKENTNVESVITGTFYDSRNIEPIVGVMLRVAEYFPIPKKDENERQRYDFVQSLGSAITNQEGYYNIPFSASRNCNAYLLEYEIDDRYSSAPNVSPGNIDIDGRNIQIENLGGIINQDFEFWKNYYLKFRVVVYDNPFPPVNINRYHLDGMVEYNVSASSIYNTDNDTIRFIRVANNNTNFLKFMITDDKGNILKNNQDIPVEVYSDTDTIEYDGIIELYPNEFEFYMKN